MKTRNINYRCGCLFTHVMHGRSRMIIVPRTPTMLGRIKSGFHRPGGRHCMHEARNTVRCSVSCRKGKGVGGGG